MKINRFTWIPIISIMLIAAIWKMLLLLWDVVPFNADEAVVGLMARHILLGARPVFFYGQAYMGSLDAFLVAACFGIFGQQVWCIRLVQVVLYLAIVASTIFIGKEAFGSLKTGILAGLLLAVPTVNVTLYTTASLGGYGEALFLGNLILWVALYVTRKRISCEESRFPWVWFAGWGLLVGAGLWANGLSLVYSAPAGIFLLWQVWNKRRAWLAPFLIAIAAGFLIGALPWWLYALNYGSGQLILELLGKAVSVEQEPWLARTTNHLVNFLLLGISVIFGFRPPWSVQWLGLLAIPFVMAFWVAVSVFWLKCLMTPGPQRKSFSLLAGVGGVLLAGFLFTPFGIDPSGRYFLPLAVPLALAAAHMILSVSRYSWQVVLLTTLLIGYNIWGTLECALRYPPGLTTQFYEPTIIDHRADNELIEFLQNEGETRGYSNYWVSYPLAFLSKEEIIFVPQLPYHLDLRYTPRDDRYLPYREALQASQKVAYITTRNPNLDQYLRERFLAIGVTWQEKIIGDYRVYYRLSRVVRPLEIGLGGLRE